VLEAKERILDLEKTIFAEVRSFGGLASRSHS